MKELSTTIPDDSFPDANILAFRLGALTKETVTWWENAKLGSVRSFLQTSGQFGYSTSVFHSFSNAITRKEILTFGTTHVAMGFVDLNVLRDAIFNGEFSASGPLKWVGYEICPFAIAKTMVIIELLKHPSITPKAIAQIWYSATWADSVWNLFRTAAETLYRQEMSPSDNSEVMALLENWSSSTKVSLEVARSEWLRSIDVLSIADVSCLVQKEDRIAFLKYIITGDLFGGGPIGSTCMFKRPRNFRPDVRKDKNESFLGTVSFVDLISMRKRNSHFIAAGEQWILRRLQN